MEEPNRPAEERRQRRILLKAAGRAAREKLRRDRDSRDREARFRLSRREELLLQVGWVLLLFAATPVIRRALFNAGPRVWLLLMGLPVLTLALMLRTLLLNAVARLSEGRSQKQRLVSDFLEEFEKYPDSAASFLRPSELAYVFECSQRRRSQEDSRQECFVTDPVDKDDGPRFYQMPAGVELTSSSPCAIMRADEGGLEAVLDLGDITALDSRTAAVLSAHAATLKMNRLTSLNSDVARALSQYEGRLELNGIEFLSSDVAAILADYKGIGLTLLGIKALNEDAAALLSKNCRVILPEQFRW